MRIQTDTETFTTALTATLVLLDPNLTQDKLDQLISETLANLSPAGTPRVPLGPKTYTKVATAQEVLQQALSYRKQLVAAALRPSRNTASSRWVVRFTFRTWHDALAFARVWGEKIKLNLNVQRDPERTYSVSIALLNAPADPTPVTVHFTTPEAVTAFAQSLRGLWV